ncbi:LOW QUALITY PROTEIN: hypothetical protein CVT26_014615 [Gymnopilus dilepis]|uniref:NodB homology domain-containing protein n=1 Tax=Gymnopilus dilepis TaxID=231916 RepID=A0A409VWN6_9AGAR|nr:LOW QUALITY PROTEIN: hypothetical protein CVT26_014615 [Gymnopilus dilepis]
MLIWFYAGFSLTAWVSASPARKREGEAQVVTNCVEPDTAALTFLRSSSDYPTEDACIYDDDSVNRVLYAYRNGHQIGSHTWSHKDLTTLSWDNIHNEMWLVERKFPTSLYHQDDDSFLPTEAFQKIVGVTPAFMRPPFGERLNIVDKAYGNYNDLVRQAAYIRGQALALWDFDSGDSTGSTASQSEDAYEKLISKHPSNILALNHETEG